MKISHDNAAGLSITDPGQFSNDMNAALKDVSTDIVYYVDYIYDSNNIDSDAILDLAEMNDYIGTGFSRPQVYVENCLINNNYMIMKDKHLKISLPGCDVIMWDINDDLKDRLQNGEIININFIAKCNINEYNWERNPQLIIEDWEETPIENQNIIESWGF